MNYPSSDSIGIVGQGFVGSAIREGLKDSFTIETYDKFSQEKSTCSSLVEICEKTFIVFLCLPTPMKKDGSCDLTILNGVIEEINAIASGDHILIIKSTIPPGTTASFNKIYENVKIVFSPEFLTEANSFEDFKSQNRIIVGGERPASTIVKNLLRVAFPKINIVKTGSNTAEMVKYFTNCFLATKVSFANEMRQICEQVDIDYDKVVEYSLYDERIGKTHLSSPGPDGSLGFGGSCFPKDVNALISFSKKLDVSPTVLSAVWHKNLEVRPEKDWEKLKGRAVSE